MSPSSYCLARNCQECILFYVWSIFTHSRRDGNILCAFAIAVPHAGRADAATARTLCQRREPPEQRERDDIVGSRLVSLVIMVMVLGAGGHGAIDWLVVPIALPGLFDSAILDGGVRRRGSRGFGQASGRHDV